MPINHWRGPCRYCSKVVGRRKGQSARSTVTGKWLVWHGRCDPMAPTNVPKPGKFNRKPPPEPPPAPRLPYAADDD